MPDILYIRAMGHESLAFLELATHHNVEAHFLRELTEADFSRYKAILVPAHVDQRGLARFHDAIGDFLDAGGLLVFNGHLTYPVIPGLAPFVPAPGGGRDDLIVERVGEHPVFADVDVTDLSFRRGVAGFYGRGENPLPEGAIALHRLQKSGAILDWYWERPQGGRILMHSGNPLWMYVGDDCSAARIAPQLLQWVNATLQ
ncbi:MAG: hypothetical protein LBB51_06525 [Zoogloeaceae bacterium]|jgi:hypothetical protein|nr:hypothetical protein [Zoogloeaceae bacterium]